MENHSKLTLNPLDLLAALGNLICLATLAGFAGRFYWILELFSHFRVQYFLSLAVLALILGVKRRFRWAATLAAFAIVNLILILPLYVDTNSNQANAGPALRIVSSNVKTANSNYAGVLGLVRKYQPDFVVLQEVNAQWLSALGELERDYPYAIAKPREDNFGIALFSRLPFTRAEIVYIGEARLPSALAQVEVRGRTLTLLATHPLPPVSGLCASRRNQQLAASAEFLQTIDPPILLVGDLNMSPWSFYFQRLLRQTGLQDSSRGYGFQPTWPGHIPFLLTPLDHCLHSPDLHILNRKVGGSIGSDHYPLIVDFALTDES